MEKTHDGRVSRLLPFRQPPGFLLFQALTCSFCGHMQGPTVSPVYCKRDGKVSPDYYAIVICVPKKALYKSVQQLRAVSYLILMEAMMCYYKLVIQKL